MTPEEIVESNKLIAEFMALQKNATEYYITAKGAVALGELEYHSSWNDLMPVVEKIEALKFEDDLSFAVEIHRNGCRITRSWTTVDKPDFGWHQTGAKMHSTWKAVVEFIKWYNSDNRNNQ